MPERAATLEVIGLIMFAPLLYSIISGAVRLGRTMRRQNHAPRMLENRRQPQSPQARKKRDGNQASTFTYDSASRLATVRGGMNSAGYSYREFAAGGARLLHEPFHWHGFGFASTKG
jgi:hypothetical protein